MIWLRKYKFFPLLALLLLASAGVSWGQSRLWTANDDQKLQRLNQIIERQSLIISQLSQNQLETDHKLQLSEEAQNELKIELNFLNEQIAISEESAQTQANLLLNQINLTTRQEELFKSYKESTDRELAILKFATGTGLKIALPVGLGLIATLSTLIIDGNNPVTTAKVLVPLLGGAAIGVTVDLLLP